MRFAPATCRLWGDGRAAINLQAAGRALMWRRSSSDTLRRAAPRISLRVERENAGHRSQRQIVCTQVIVRLALGAIDLGKTQTG